MWLAMRSVRRSKGRSGLLAGVLTLLLLLVLGLQAMLDGLLVQFVGAIEHQSGEVLVLGVDARRNVAGSVVTGGQLEAVAAVEGVDRVDPVVQGTVSVPVADVLVDVAVFGHRLDGVGGPTAVAEGRAARHPGEAVAGSGHDADGLGLGDEVPLGAGGPIVEVVGLAEDADYLAQPTLFVDLAAAVDAKRAANPDAAGVPATVLAVAPADGVDPRTLADRIGDEVPGVEALTRRGVADAAPGVAAMSQSVLLIVTVTLVAALVVVGFAFVILVVQETPRTTLMRALGAPASQVVGAQVVQITIVVAVALGGAAALLAAAATTGADGGMLRLTPSALLTNAVLLAAGLLAAIAVPLRRAARIDPAAIMEVAR